MKIQVVAFWIITPCSVVVGCGERQQGPPKCWYPAISQHGATTHKTTLRSKRLSKILRALVCVCVLYGVSLNEISPITWKSTKIQWKFLYVLSLWRMILNALLRLIRIRGSRIRSLAQLVKKFPRFYGTPSFITVFTGAQQFQCSV